MEIKETSLTSFEFLENFQGLKVKLQNSLPPDLISYQCENCESDVILNGDGILKLSEPLKKSIGIVINDRVEKLIEAHYKEQEECKDKICVHSTATPENIIVSFPETNLEYVTEFVLSNDCFKPKLIVVQKYLPQEVIFVLYQKETVHNEEYLEFIKSNYVPHLDEIVEENVIFDDETALHYQQLMPRFSGGGRKIRAKFNYECYWCPKATLKMGHGRFKYLKSYKAHFKKLHHGEKGTGVPMSTFLKNLEKNDPKWYCDNCDRYYSLGNYSYHKEKCEQSGDESNEPEIRPGPSNDKKSVQKKRSRTLNSSSDDDEQDSENEHLRTIDTVSKSIDQPNKRIINTTENDMEENVDESSENTNTRDNAMCVDESLERNRSSRENIIGNDCEVVEDRDINLRRKKQSKTVEKDYSFLDEIEDELLHSPKLEPSFEQEHAQSPSGSKEITEQLNIEFEVHFDQPASSSKDVLNRWWLDSPNNLYGDRGLGGPHIFLPEDSEEFVQQCMTRYIQHVKKKALLDRKMQEAESVEAQLLQFSLERDEPILDMYTNFVKISSTKDVIRIFSEEYEQLQIPAGSKSSTAEKYKNRIIEFFNHMSNLYQNFHLDWMLDYKGEIEKMYKDGNTSKEIFLPTKEDITSFIKKFKYGGKSC